MLQPMTDAAPRVVVQKAAQVGATVMAILRAVWFLAVHQAQTMYLFPTHRSAARFSRGRFQVLLEHSPLLRTLFRAVKNAAHLRAGPVNFYCHGARSRVELLSTPVQYLTMDERDELYLGAVSSKQSWSAVELARKRLSGQREFWELNLSTPTIPGHGVAAEFARSDQHVYYLHCPHCGEFVHPTWPEAIGGLACDTFHFRCERCGECWTQDERRIAIRAGCWRPRFPGRPLRGYHLSQLISPVVTAERLVQQYRASEHSPQGRQVFFNSVLGLPYLAEGARMDAALIAEAMARGGEQMAHASQGSVMGVDVGPTWLHVVLAEKVGEVLRLIQVCKRSEWRELSALIQRYRVRSFVIDAMPETHQARNLVHRHPFGWLCYYTRATGGNAVLAPNTRALHVSRTETLDKMFERWQTGKVTAPVDLPREFIDHMQALVRVVQVQRDGQARADFVDAGVADHFAHAMNYCELAASLMPPPLRFEVTPP
jgi:hypothetical protein